MTEHLVRDEIIDRASVGNPGAPSDWEYSDPKEFHYAGFACRLGAFVLDFAVYTILQIAAVVPILMLLEVFAKPSDATLDKILMICCITVMWLYYALMESSRYQATIGKKLLGIQVVDLHGNQIGFWRATVRYFAKAISALFFFLGFMVIDFTKQKQGMHDMMARCLVVKRP